MTHQEVIKRWIAPNGVGTEIGAFETPIPSLSPYYVDRFSEYAGKPCLADYWGDACHLPFRSNSLDYVASSHVLEHVANPVAALLEWHRVLADGGLIYMVVPDRRRTFDHNRNLSSPEHMWEDFQNKITQIDGTHVAEFVDGADWALYKPEISESGVAADKAFAKEQYAHAIKHEVEINIHFHVFEPENLKELILMVAERKKLSCKIVVCEEQFPNDSPNGILLVVRVKKGISGKLSSIVNRVLSRLKKKSVLTASARPISEDEELRRLFL